MASFPGQKGTGPPLPNQVTGLTAVVVGRGGGPSAPADFFVTLQGQASQGDSTFNPSAPPSFNIPNSASISLGWPDAVAGSFLIDHYEIDYSTNGGSIWNTASHTITTAAADLQGTRYKHASLTNPVSSTYGPIAGQYLPATTYLHRLRAVDSQGIPSAWVTGAKQYIYYGASGGASVGTPSGGSGSAGGGLKWGGDLSSGYPTNYAVADGTYTYVCTIDMSAAGGGYFLPTTGNNYCTFNQNVGACDYIYFILKTTNASAVIAMHMEVVGDHPMVPGGAPVGNQVGSPPNLNLNKYVQGGTVVPNTYQLYIVPLADLMTPQIGFDGANGNFGSSSAIGVLQLDCYKYLWQAQAATSITLQKAWFGK